MVHFAKMTKLGTEVIIFSAPSGSGKTTIARRIMLTFPQLKFSVSATSRAPRKNEKDGVDYHFLSVEDFKEKIENDEFLEWEEVYENQFYGTLNKAVDDNLKEQFITVFDVDVVGGMNLKKKFSEKAISFFIEPPSLESLRDRLVKRGTDDEKQIEKRLAKARKELTYAEKFDHVIVNDNLENAVSKIDAILRSKI